MSSPRHKINATAADDVEARRDMARWLPYLRVQQVQLTVAGRQTVNAVAGRSGSV
jgi:hypothetical protein